jgi:hypothetical protein
MLAGVLLPEGAFYKSFALAVSIANGSVGSVGMVFPQILAILAIPAILAIL